MSTSASDGVDLLQIALSNRDVYLFHIGQMVEMPRQLRGFLMESHTIKMGSYIKSADHRRLRDGHGVEMPNMVNLAHMAHAVGDITDKRIGLGDLYTMYTGGEQDLQGAHLQLEEEAHH